MKIIYGLKGIKKFKKPVVALGVFDGVHRGHRSILEETVRISRRIKGTSIALTFWPHPQKRKSLYSLEHRLRLIKEIGIDACIIINFSRNFAKISAEDFIKDILVKKIRAAYICIGRNFRFGQGVRGNFYTLQRLSGIYKFKIKVFKMLKFGGRAVSSTYIRSLITQGNLTSAKKLLLRPVSILGTVIKGSSLGKRLGFPTANINPHHEVVPPLGIYAVTVLLGNKRLNGLCYIGEKPTFHKCSKEHIEVYILNFKKNIYGKYLEIKFIKKIRRDKKFASAAALCLQIHKDIASSKTIFSRH